MITSDRTSDLLADLDNKVFLDVNHAARIYNCSVRTIQRRLEDGSVPVRVIGKKFFVMAKEFKAYMEQHPVE